MKLALKVGWTCVLQCMVFVCLMTLLHWKKGVSLFKKYDRNQFRNQYLKTMPQIFPKTSFDLNPSALTNPSSLNQQENFKILAEPGWAEEKVGMEIFASFFVLSAPTHQDQRDEIRRQFREMSESFEKTNQENQTFTLTFLLGKTSNLTVQNELNLEYETYRDFLWINVKDSYQNLAHKSMAFLKWIVTKQQMMKANPNSGFKTKWISKMDDDNPILTDKLIIDLSKMNSSNKVILCNAILSNPFPVRSNISIERKIRVSTSQWPENVLYPNMCLGWLYVLTPEVAEELVKASYTAPFVFIDDIYVTGILRAEADGIDLLQLDWTHGMPIFECTLFSLLRSLFITNYYNRNALTNTLKGLWYVLCGVEEIVYKQSYLCSPN